MISLSRLALFLQAASALTYNGVDWSSTIVSENAGYTWSNIDGSAGSLESIFANNGVNVVRQRLWNTDGDYGLDYNIQLAQRAQAEGLGIYLDFHFSSTWADPSHQTTPAEWQSYGVDELANAVQEYTQSTMDSFQSAGIPLEMVSIGNEITAGMLWPVGDINDGGNGPYNLATLLHAASAGIKASSMSQTPQIMIHLDNGWNWDTQEWWYDTVLAQGPLSTDDFDTHGVSYYPFYNEAATLSSLGTSLTNLKAKYGKAVMVVETDWPTSCPNPAYAFPSDAQDIGISVDGQAEWVSRVASQTEAAGGNALFYWEPAWIDNAGLGSSCEYNLMFTDSGQAMDSMAVFLSI